MAKVVCNTCYGGFGLSQAALTRLREKHGMTGDDYDIESTIARHDPRLVEVVESLGDAANGMCAKLRVYNISGKLYRIDEYDGKETIDEPADVDWVEVEP